VIKNLVLQYNSLAILCNSIVEFKELINIVTNEITISKQGFIEDREYLLENYTTNLDGGKIYALLIKDDNEFEFYVRNYNQSDLYSDWSDYKFINFSILDRKRKLKKLNENSNK
jgi:hypothetical protein